jgi:hypothetical protein
MDFSTLNGDFKQAYADDIIDLIPDFAIVQRMVPFVPSAQRSGDLYHQPVIVKNENGFTYQSPTADAYALNVPSSSYLQDAQVAGGQIVLNSVCGFNAIARSNNKNVFTKATDLLVENMLSSLGKRVELGILYGQTDLGRSSATVNTNATRTVITLTAPTFAAGIWAGMEGAAISLYRADTGALINVVGQATIAAVNVSPTVRSITIDAAAADITAIDLQGTNLAINFFGARTGPTAYTEIAGFDKIITNTGQLFNIDASVYNLWAGNVYNVAGNLTEATLDAGLAIAVSKGLQEDVTVLVSPLTWTFLNKDQAALRRYDETYGGGKKADNGFNEIAYHSVAGTQKIVAHPFVKQGEAFAVPMKRVVRCGAQEATFTGMADGDTRPTFFQLTNIAAYGITAYSNQAVLIETPAKCVKFTGITNV